MIGLPVLPLVRSTKVRCVRERYAIFVERILNEFSTAVVNRRRVSRGCDFSSAEKSRLVTRPFCNLHRSEFRLTVE